MQKTRRATVKDPFVSLKKAVRLIVPREPADNYPSNHHVANKIREPSAVEALKQDDNPGLPKESSFTLRQEYTFSADCTINYNTYSQFSHENQWVKTGFDQRHEVTIPIAPASISPLAEGHMQESANAPLRRAG